MVDIFLDLALKQSRMNKLLGYHSILEQAVFSVVSVLRVTSYVTQLNPRSSETDDLFLILIGHG